MTTTDNTPVCQSCGARVAPGAGERCIDCGAMLRVERTFEIPIGNLPMLVERMGELMKKARRLGVADAIGFEELRRFERVVERKRDPETREMVEIKRAFVEVRVFGPRPKFQGWELIGRLDFAAVPGACVRMMVPGEECPAAFHDVDAHRCDHCGHRRSRADTFLVRHEDGTIKVVGRTCLADFLGHKSPESIASLCELLGHLNALGGDDDERFGGRGRCPADDPREVLELAAYSIRTRGWASSKEDEPTKAHVGFLLCPQFHPTAEQERRAQLAEVTVKDRAMGQAAHAWILQQPTDSDYMHNLVTACSHAVTPKMLGVVVSGVVAYTRALEREVARRRRAEAEKVSQHVGEVKQRLDIEGEVTFVRSFDSRFGVTTLVKLADDAGNIFTWFASTAPEVTVGDKVKVRGTVKKHDDYKGVKQTVLTRCKLEVVEEQLAEAVEPGEVDINDPTKPIERQVQAWLDSQTGDL